MISKIFNSLSNIEKTILVSAVIVFLITFALMASLYYADNTYAVPDTGGEYREGVVGQPVFINPILPETEADRDISRLVFGGLGDISSSVKRSEDGTVWKVRIHDDIKWHDGERVTSDDILFTLDTIQNRDAESILFSSFQGINAERVSELEVRFTLQAPYAFFEEEHLTSMSLIPKHIFGDLPVQNFQLSTFGLNPIGFGPYKADGFHKDSRGVIQSFNLVAVKDAPNRPNINRIIFKFFRNETELVEAYNSGEIDGFGLSSHEILSRENLEDSEDLMEITARHKMNTLRSSRYYAIFINQALVGEDLKDIDVRRALSDSVDRRELIEKVFGGHAVPLHGPTIFTSAPSNETNDETTSEEGEEILEELDELELHITLPDETFLIRTAEALKEQWENLGIEVELNILPLKDIQETVLRNNDYKMLMFGNITGASNDLFSFWHSSRRFYPDQNLSLYQDSETDELLEDFRRNFDKSTKNEQLKEISDRIASDYPAIFLYSPDYIYVSAPRLGGFSQAKTMNTSSDRFSDITNWHVNTKRVWAESRDSLYDAIRR